MNIFSNRICEEALWRRGYFYRERNKHKLSFIWQTDLWNKNCSFGWTVNNSWLHIQFIRFGECVTLIRISAFQNVCNIPSIIMKLHKNFDAFIFGVHMTTALISFNRYLSKWMLLLMLKEWLSFYGIFHKIFWSPLALMKKYTILDMKKYSAHCKFNEKKSIGLTH